MARPSRALATPILEILEAELASILFTDDAFNSSPTIREQRFHACRILRDEHHPRAFQPDWETL
jgi:hypothetical protein